MTTKNKTIITAEPNKQELSDDHGTSGVEPVLGIAARLWPRHAIDMQSHSSVHSS